MPFLADYQTRSQLPEIMDDAQVRECDFLRAMAEIRWVNRYLNGTGCILTVFKRLCKKIPNDAPLRILDLGTASADIPKALVQWAKKSGRLLSITALDLHPVAVQAARQYVQNHPKITVVQGDAMRLSEQSGDYDFVISSMFLHHLDDDAAIQLLKSMAKKAQRGFVINDLQRHPLAWLGIRLLGWLTGKGKIFRYDSALSVKRAFTRKELESFCMRAGLPEAQVEHHFPFRWVIVWLRAGNGNG
ncbi:methyltransferase domain-containing protein [Vampirovibrio sp.]|uniref:methyltransferase domain-containing protein n=1 Tax=Vampirovibrio sp. TaxID=2717857 RepID=UPI00359363B8